MLGKKRRLLYLTAENPGMKKYQLVVTTLVLFLLTACEDHYGICDVPRAVYLEGDFYKLNGGQETAATAPSLFMAYLNNNTNIYNNAAGLNEFKVLLSPIEDTMHYLVRLDPGLPADTLSVVYSTQPYNISEECGMISVYNLNTVYSTRNTIDSVAITSRER